ncbi:GspE/PulE family protein [Antarcticirhabdus aurantiaca]|uniref:GspE/PulE family protein n=1 Tax=Antarcticirhabdus aurantiaca TaxID=2606717 RepID=A0ACD4NLT1_9HYPH|nr:GspE/PulE family protein [Antarcticirhabdus aurantiaca]WAJ27835.1 GspE/PulE family protein [Jeongeuplla avenae]
MRVWASKRRPKAVVEDRRGGALRADARLDAATFLDHLRASGAIEPHAAERARAGLEAAGSLPVVLTELGLLSEADLVVALSDWTGLPPAEPGERLAEPVLARALPRDYCRRCRVLPLEAGDAPRVALADPFRESLRESLLYSLGPAARLCVIGPNAFDAAFRALYGDEDGGEAEGEAEEFGGGDTERLEDAARQAPIIRLAGALLRTAFELGASDIHVEPGETELAVRYRVDGVLVRPETYPKAVHTGLVTRIKILAGLNIAERRLPQDGRMTSVDRGREVDVRVSVLPTANGEALVLRLLGQGQGGREAGSITALGFPAVLGPRVERMAERPNGIVLVTGPTGSGKTTTLYTLIARLDDGRRKIVTVEDPVEYRMPGIAQVQTHAGIGLDFTAALRSILRQDPDVVMIGEIRDGETARIAVQAALTGHLVLSTLHTNSAAAAVTRLSDMGVEPYLLAATLNGILAERLVRLLCPDCRRMSPATPAERRLLERRRPALKGAPTLTLAHPAGCPACSGTGYRGRAVIAEGIDVDEAFRTRISARDGEAALEAQARASGLGTLADHGIDRVLALQTSLSEVLRHVDLRAPPDETRLDAASGAAA